MKKKSVSSFLLGAACAVGACNAPAEGAAPPPRKIVALLDATQNFGTTRRSVNFYDVTDLTGTVFNQAPLFSAWTGYEDFSTLNFEDPDALTVNPINGTVYMTAFDSGTAGTIDAAGDTEGDYDLYRIDYQEILKDFLTNGRAVGTMYAPTTGPDGTVNPQHPQHAGTTVNLAGIVQKVGEIGRTQGGPFYDYALEFADPANLMLLDNQTGLDTDPDTVPNDHQLRFVSRTSTAPGGAVYSALDHTGGFNQQTAQSWRSDIGALVDMDNASGRSEPVDMAYVSRDGVKGVWVAESDGGGDDLSYFELNFTTKTAVKKEMQVGPSPYPTGFALDNDPVVNPASNDGVADWVQIDKNGNLLIGESGFFESPVPTEPKVISRAVLNYDAADTDANTQDEIVFGAWGTSANVAPTLDDDVAVTDGRFVTIDKGTGRVYFFDIDSGAAPNVVSDAYVFDLATGTLVYQELNAVNHFLERQGVSFFLRGDVNGDGVVNASDIDRLFAGVADPTLGGQVTSAIGREWYDLTGDALLTGVNGDADELVEEILGTAYGDANLDGMVSGADFALLQNRFGQAGGWADGDFNGNGTVNGADFALLQNNFGFNAMGPVSGPVSSAVPEPTTFGLTFLGGIPLFARRRRRNLASEKNA